MVYRLPGGIDSPEGLWQVLLRGDDRVTEIPAGRWDADEYYDPEPGTPGRSVAKWDAFLDDSAGFDAEFFGISEREATAIPSTGCCWRPLVRPSCMPVVRPSCMPVSTRRRWPTRGPVCSWD